MNIYLDDDKIAAFLVNASISHLVGTPIESSGQTGGGQAQPKQLAVEIQLDGKAIGSKEPYSVVVGTPAELPVDISTISAKKEPYTVTIIATSETNQTFSTTTELIKLPLRTDNGTAVRIDNLYGGLGLRKASDSSWQPFYPYTYYVQWDRYFNTSPSTLETFSDMGYNVIHIVPTGSLGQSPFPRDEFQPFLDKAAELGLLLHYDVLFLEKGLANMTEQVQWLESHPSILSWYIADEPDGKSVLPSKLREGYERIRSLDLYHPVSLALNCYDFYYEEYASGADIVLSDVYPISTNTSYSTVYNTTCNATYGCCGCDDCHGSFEDVSVRLDNFARIDDLIGWPKIHWNVPQAFGSPVSCACEHPTTHPVAANVPPASPVVLDTESHRRRRSRDESPRHQPCCERVGPNRERNAPGPPRSLSSQEHPLGIPHHAGDPRRDQQARQHPDQLRGRQLPPQDAPLPRPGGAGRRSHRCRRVGRRRDRPGHRHQSELR
jgi:hypothetical protein